MRLLEPEHAEEVFAVIDSHRQHIRRWMSWPDITPTSAELRQYAMQSLEGFAQRKHLALTILQDGRVVGGTGLSPWQQKKLDTNGFESHTADIGYWLIETAQGQGVMTRCVTRLIELAFDEYKIHRLTIRAEPKNERSNAIPERLGFTLEGTMRHVCRYDGRWINHNLWSRLSGE